MAVRPPDEGDINSLTRRTYMKRNLIYVGIGIAVLFMASLAIAKDKKGPMSGTWDCQSHGGSQGDMTFTLILQQNNETVDGSISSPMGGTQISSGTFKKNMLEIHLDTPQGNYTLMAKYNKGALSGTWSSDSDKGSWEGKKATASQ
jgi:hypothetical protein